MGYPDLESEVILDNGLDVGVILDTTLLACDPDLWGIKDDDLLVDFMMGSSVVDRVRSSSGIGRLCTL